MAVKHWETYEEVATYLLNTLAEHFGVGRFEGKQILPGESGTEWEIDAKGFSDHEDRIIIVECKRHTKKGINQAITSSLAWTIRDVGAQGGILVSPLGLQEGAHKVAKNANIVEVLLSQDSTTTDFMLSFLNQVHFGISETLFAQDHVTAEVRDKDGNLVVRR